MNFNCFKLTGIDLNEKSKDLASLCALWIEFPYAEIFDSLIKKEDSYHFFYVCDEKKHWCAGLYVFSSSFSTEILYIYSKAEFRNQGLARKLLLRLFDDLKPKNPQNHEVFLEVRISNIAAIKLYQSVGMEQVGYRKKYYKDGEDALVFKIVISQESQ